PRPRPGPYPGGRSGRSLRVWRQTRTRRPRSRANGGAGPPPSPRPCPVVRQAWRRPRGLARAGDQLGDPKRLPRRPVDRARAESPDRGAMRRSGVTLVVGETPTGVEVVVLDHRSVAGDLGHDARAHDRGADLVA